jgi:anhydro-N-acetylmuramic acid kinase
MTRRPPAHYVGASSGTSADGLDLALLEISTNSLTISAGAMVPFDSQLRDRLLALGVAEADDIDNVGATDVQLGRFIGTSIRDFLAQNRVPAESIRAIGSHGQTVRHRTRSHTRFTMQIGDPNQVAELTGITTVADFRRRDIAAGGEGAPLVPPFHQALFGRKSSEPQTVVNIGGMANITVLPLGPTRSLRGFDTGPGNTLLDAWIRTHRQLPFDHDGEWASRGRIIDTLLDSLRRDAYFAAPPPKSTGRETFNLAWLERHVASLDEVPSPVDVQSTLSELTAGTIADALCRWGHATGNVIVAGGGRLNRDLMSRIERLLPKHRVQVSERVGVNGDWLEAAAFAWLAHRTIKRLAGNAPAVTGAKAARVLGAIYASNPRA